MQAIRSRYLLIMLAFAGFTCSSASDVSEEPADEPVFAGPDPVYPDNARDSLAALTPTVVSPPATSSLP